VIDAEGGEPVTNPGLDGGRVLSEHRFRWADP
jgi:hypothetical protein